LHQAISTILVAPPAEQQLHAFDKPLRKLVVKRLQALPAGPCPPGGTKLEGLDHLYRIREGTYRIVYAIRDRELIVLGVKSGVRGKVVRS
jgi:mRNA interferase RelE/StbE